MKTKTLVPGYPGTGVVNSGAQDGVLGGDEAMSVRYCGSRRSVKAAFVTERGPSARWNPESQRLSFLRFLMPDVHSDAAGGRRGERPAPARRLSGR